MRLVRVAFALLAVLLVAGVVLEYSAQANLAVATQTVRFTTTTTLTTALLMTRATNGTETTTVYENAVVAGNCTAVYHDIPDTIEEIISMSTVTQDGHTSITTYYTTEIPATEEIGPTSTYTTTSYANYTSTFVVTSTSQDLNAIPSDAWVVSVCTYGR